MDPQSTDQPADGGDDQSGSILDHAGKWLGLGGEDDGEQVYRNDYVYADGSIMHTEPPGEEADHSMRIISHPDGSIDYPAEHGGLDEHQAADGSLTTYLPEGGVTTLRPDGSWTVQEPDETSSEGDPALSVGEEDPAGL